MADNGKKKGIRGAFQNAAQKTTSFVKKIVAATVAGTVLIGGPVYYNYGTVQETDVKVTGFKTVENDPKDYTDNTYIFTTNKGNYRNTTSLAHLKTQDDVRDQYSRTYFGYYRIKSYANGIPLITPNITEIQPITEAEYKEREKAQLEEAAAARKAAAADPKLQSPGTTAQPGQPQTATPAQPAQTGVAYSGLVKTYNLVSADGRHLVQVTGPIEADGKITVNSVTPLQAAPANPAPSSPPRT